MKAFHDGNFATFKEAKEKLQLVPTTEREGIKPFILKNHPKANVTFCDFPWVDHTEVWILRDTPQRRKLREWVKKGLATPRPDK